MIICGINIKDGRTNMAKNRDKWRFLKILIAFVVATTMILGTAGTFLVYLFTQVFHK